MNIKTDSIIDSIEIALNKKIDGVYINDLDKITYLRISKIDMDQVLFIDISELQYFSNLEEISIEYCMVDINYINEIRNVKNLKKISFIGCDFVDDAKNFFEELSINELVLNNVTGIKNINFSNLKLLTIINCNFAGTVNVDMLDISRSAEIKLDLDNSSVQKIIVNEIQYMNKYICNDCTIVVKDDHGEVAMVINNE